MQTSLRSKFVAAFSSSAIILGSVSGCATHPDARTGQRGLSSEEKPLNAEQLKNIGDLGIGVLRMAVLGNALTRDHRITTDLAAKLEKIETDRRESIQGAGGASIVAGIGGPLATVSLKSFDEMLEMISSGFSLFLGGPTHVPIVSDKSMRIVYAAGGGLVVSGAGLLIAGSVGAESVQNTKASDAEVAAAKKKRADLQAELDRNVASMTDIYAKVFGLEPSAVLVLRGKIRAEIMEKAKAGQDTISIDVAGMMVPNLISEAAFVAFRSNIAALEVAERSEQSMRALLDARNYEANIEQCKTILRTYVAWVRSALPEIKNRVDAARAAKALAHAERLLLRI